METMETMEVMEPTETALIENSMDTDVVDMAGGGIGGQILKGAIIFGAGFVVGVVAPVVRDWFKSRRAAKKAKKVMAEQKETETEQTEE